MERWRIRSERSGLALDKLEGQISVIDDPIGNNLETVRRQEDAFEVSLGTTCFMPHFGLNSMLYFIRQKPVWSIKGLELGPHFVFNATKNIHSHSSELHCLIPRG